MQRTGPILSISLWVMRSVPPYDEERVIGEYLIRECSDELDDKLKYKAFEYAIYGILETIDIDDISSAETA